MLSQAEILSTIKTLVKEEIPDAKVYLFGSRATGKVHEESDWDILVITRLIVDKNLKRKVRNKIHSITLSIFSFIDLIIVNEKEWKESPSYYALNISIKDEVIAI